MLLILSLFLMIRINKNESASFTFKGFSQWIDFLPDFLLILIYKYHLSKSIQIALGNSSSLHLIS